MDSDNSDDNGESLDVSEQRVDTAPQNQPNITNQDTPDTQPQTGQTENTPEKPKPRLFQDLNIYLLLFILILLLSGVVITISYLQSKNNAKEAVIKSQSLTQNTLNQLANNDVSVGAPKQVLNVEANAVFAGKVLISGGLQVAGSTQINGSLTLSGITVSGIGTFQQITTSGGLTVSGNTSLQGSTTIAQSLQVNGNTTVSGNLSTSSLTTGGLNLSGDLSLGHHLVTSGTSPLAQSNSNLGSGGTTSINGSDTAGNININTGSNPVAGCLVTISFNKSFSTTPYILLTPSSSDAASINYYVSRQTSSFSICDSTTPPTGGRIDFDYFVID